MLNNEIELFPALKKLLAVCRLECYFEAGTSLDRCMTVSQYALLCEGETLPEPRRRFAFLPIALSL